MKKILFYTMLLLVVSCSQIDLAKSRIVVDSSVAVDKEAAEFMQKYVKIISGTELELAAKDTELEEGDIVIGTANGTTNSELTPDGFSISTLDGKLRIMGSDKGVIFGVGEVLENYFGVKYWAPHAIDIPKTKRMALATDIDYISNPALEIRDFGGTNDEDLKKFIRSRSNNELFAAGMFVHTFRHLVPLETYGKSNPEYYSYINGERRPGNQGQLCLTNEDVFTIIVAKLDSIFKANPTKPFISVSQNDSQFSYCQCSKCKAIDEKEEALSGSLVHFCNKIAERFPDKQISTLAYNYSVKPPKYVKPRENVNIMLCNIESNRQLPITETDPGFVKNLEDWAQITDNFYFWDYGINFSNHATPFPNFHILAPNIQTLHKNKVSRIFYCNAGYDTKGDFTELRNYMVSKLYWDPYQDPKAVKETFVNGYYQDAAPYISEYLELIEKNLLDSGLRLWIYDTPASHRDGFLKPEFLEVYNNLFDKAEAAVKDNPDVLERVLKSRVSLQMAELEVMRTISDKDVEELRNKVELFDERTKHFKVGVLGECGIHAQDYAKEYERYLPSGTINKAKGAKVEWVVKPADNYVAMATELLTDDLYGGTTFGQGWIGWEGKDVEFIVDLGKEIDFTIIEADFLQNLSSWVFLPKSVTYEISTDRKKYTKYGTVSKPINDGSKENRRDVFEKFTVDKIAKARYIKVKIDALKECPTWHFGLGHTCWLFVDELTVL